MKFQEVIKDKLIDEFFKAKKGFTILELLIVIAISGFVIGAAYTLIDTASRTTTRTTTQVREQNDLRNAMNWLAKDLQNTTSDMVIRGTDPYYDIKGVKYTLVPAGTIGDRKVYNIVRKSSEEEFVLIESVPEIDGLDIDAISSDFYNITITTIDKFNEDRTTTFQISRRFGTVVKPALMIAAHALYGDTIKMQGVLCKTPDSTNDTWVLTLTTGTVKSGVTGSDVIINNLPAGLNCNVSSSVSENRIYIKVTGTANNEISGIVNVGVIIKSSAVTQSGASDSSEIQVKLVPVSTGNSAAKYMITTSSFLVKNNATINGDTRLGDGTSAVSLDNNINFYGNVYVNSDFSIRNNANFGTSSKPVKVYVNGNFNVGQNVEIYGDLYCRGTISNTKKLTVHGRIIYGPVDIPPVSDNVLKSEDWYKSQGYTIVNTSYDTVNLQNGGKYYFCDNYTINNNSNTLYDNIIIAGQKNLTFTKKFNCNGVLFAPNGIISFNNGCNVTGIIAAKQTTCVNNIVFIYKLYPNLPF